MTEININKYDLDYLEQVYHSIKGRNAIAGYLRVSTRHQAFERYSIETQQRIITRECLSRYGAECTIVWFKDEGYSGTLPIKQEGMNKKQYRPAFSMMALLIAQGAISNVIAADCSRIARDLFIWKPFERDYLEPYKVTFLSPTEEVDTTTQQGKDQIAYRVALAARERCQSKADGDRGRKVRTDAGHFLGVAPYGWKFQDRSSVPKGQRVSIEPVEKQAAVVQKMVHMNLSGRDASWIARNVTSQGILTFTGKQRWGVDMVLLTLRNPVNCGYLRDKGQGLRLGIHFDQRIIQKSEYEAVQCLLTNISKQGRYQFREIDQLFMGLAVCGLCGRPLRVHKSPASGANYYCSLGIPSKTHTYFSVLSDIAYDAVLRSIGEVASSVEIQKATTERLRAMVDQQFGDPRAQETRLLRELKRIDEKFLAWSRSIRDLSESEVSAAADRFQKKKVEITSKLSEIAETLRRRELFEQELGPAIALLQDFPQLWKSMEIKQKRGLLKRMVTRFVLKPEGNFVRLDLSLITGYQKCVLLHVQYQSSLNKGLEGLTRKQLRMAAYLLQGMSPEQITQLRGCTIQTIEASIKIIKERAGTDDLNKALKLAAPYVEQRRSELALPDIVKAHSDRSTCSQDIQFLELVAAGFNTQEIKKRMMCDAKEINRIRRRAFHRLGVNDQENALREARVRGLIRDYSDCEKLSDDDIAIIKKLAAQTSYASVATEHAMSVDELLAHLAELCAHCGVAKNYQLFEFASHRGWIETIKL
jgi:DNA invertase Pin-like site-specific DNA recombinase/DNA-binding CsgD family transcriptional regulator